MKGFESKEFRAVWAAMKPDIFTTRLFFDPLAVPLTILFSKFRWMTPNRVSLLALMTGLAGAVCFFQGRFLAGAGGYYLFFLFDSIDGKLARMQASGSRLGGFYDFSIDRLVIGAMSFGLCVSFFNRSDFRGFAGVLGFLIFFFLKDVLDLKWKESGVGGATQVPRSSGGNGFFARNKIHFKPGQLLSCFILFLAGPLTGAFFLCSLLASGCVLLSLTHNVVLPFLSFVRAERRRGFGRMEGP